MIENILFIDIETVGCEKSYKNLSDEMKFLWNKKADQIAKDSSYEESFENRSGIYSEFGKIAVISIGYFSKERKIINTKVFASRNELSILEKFKEEIEKLNQEKLIFCGHNIKEFDIPYICRRMLLNSLSLPRCISIAGKKPWEVFHIDTMELWSFGDRKSYSSLNLLTTIFGIESSKSSIDGSKVHETFYEEETKEENLKIIAKYCAKDVEVVAKLFFRLKSLPFEIENNFIEYCFL